MGISGWGWDKMRKFFTKPHTWTGQQTFSNIAITGGTITGTTINENFTTSTNPASSVATTTAIVDAYNGVVITTNVNNTQTIATPTAATVKYFTVINNDTSSSNQTIKANGVDFVITPGEGQCFLWDGSAWGPTDLGITSIPVIVSQGGTGRVTGTTAYSLVATGTTATGAQQTLANGATTEVLVGGGASALPIWTTATGSGAPVRATSPTLVTPLLGTPTSGDLQNCTAATATTKGVVELATAAEITTGTEPAKAIAPDQLALSSPTVVTVKCSSLTDLRVPKHTSDAVGLADTTITVSANNEVTNASQPAVLAQVTSIVENVTGDTTEYSMAAAIWTEIYDQNADFADGIFTAPVTGRYAFNLNLRLSGIASSNTSLRIAAVASNRTIPLTLNPYAILDTSYDLVNILFLHDIDMDAGDTLYFTVNSGPTGKGVDIHNNTYLSVRLLF